MTNGTTLSSTQPCIQRDTALWQLQTWVSFGLAAGLSGIGLVYLPGEPIEKSFMVMGYVFCLTSAFMLSKFVRDAEHGGDTGRDTPLWKLVVWGSFACAMGLTGWGLTNLAVNPTYKAYLAVSWLFMMSSGFTLAKMLRDRHEADLQEAASQGRSRNANAGTSTALHTPAAAHPANPDVA